MTYDDVIDALINGPLPLYWRQPDKQSAMITYRGMFYAMEVAIAEDLFAAVKERYGFEARLRYLNRQKVRAGVLELATVALASHEKQSILRGEGKKVQAYLQSVAKDRNDVAGHKAMVRLYEAVISHVTQQYA